MIPLVKIATVMADAIAENLCGTQKSFEVELYLYDRFGQMDTIDYLDLFESFAAKSALSQQKSQVKLEEKPSVMAGTKSFIVPRREDMTHDIFVSYSRSDEDKERLLLFAEFWTRQIFPIGLMLTAFIVVKTIRK
jgi:hypothetical protein